MSHPDPNGPDLHADSDRRGLGRAPVSPVSAPRSSSFLDRNPEGRVVAELIALVGARVVGEHAAPAIVERFTVPEGELTVKRDGQTSILREGETGPLSRRACGTTGGTRRPRREGRAWRSRRGERFAHMIETLFGLARPWTQGHAGRLQLALFARFSDVFALGSPPAAVQRGLFGGSRPSRAGAARATYPRISRTVRRRGPRSQRGEEARRVRLPDERGGALVVVGQAGVRDQRCRSPG